MMDKRYMSRFERMCDGPADVVRMEQGMMDARAGHEPFNRHPRYLRGHELGTMIVERDKLRHSQPALD